MRCERRLYGISGITFNRVGKAGCLQRSPACELAARAHWKGTETWCCFPVATLVLESPSVFRTLEGLAS